MNKLEKAYRETTYSIFIDEEKVEINIGKVIPSVINELLGKEKEKSAIILTAWNPRSKALSIEINKEQNNNLHANLINNKHTFVKALGQGLDTSWAAEESFFIVGVTEQTAEQLAVEYDQYAYVWCEYGKQASLRFTQLWSSMTNDS